MNGVITKHDEDSNQYRKEYSKVYYHTYKEVINQKRNEKVKCSKCGKIITKQSVWAHKRSKKCLKLQGLYEDTGEPLKEGPVYKPKDIMDEF